MKTIQLLPITLVAAVLFLCTGCSKTEVANLSVQDTTYGSASILKSAPKGHVTMEATAADGHLFCYWVAADDRKADTVSTANPLIIKKGKYKKLYPVFNRNGADADNPFEIYTTYDFSLLSAGNEQLDQKSHSKLMEDITVAKEYKERLNGIFDGNGHTITADSADVLFSYVDKSGIVRNLGVVGVCISAGIARSNSGIIECCRIAANVGGSTAAAGIALDNLGTIRNCYVTGTVSATSQKKLSEVNVGGICRLNGAVISNCYVSGAVSASVTLKESNLLKTEAGGIAINLENDSVKYCVAACPSVTLNQADGIKTQYCARVAVPRPSYTGNYALSDMAGNWSIVRNDNSIGEKDLAGYNGKDVTAEQLHSEAWWADAATGIWKDVWGGTDTTKPWKWDDARNLPALWWEK